MSSEFILESFHTRFPGASARVFGLADTGDGRTSYERLAHLLPPDAHEVLDLACGDGPLLSVLQRRGVARPVGLDRNEAELAAARARCPGVELRQGRAEALPWPEASFDAALCHMALMLMDDPAAVLTELHRVLRPGGLFAAVVACEGPISEPMREVYRTLHPLWQRHGYLPPLGDARASSEQGLRELFDARWSEVDFVPYDLVQEVAPGELPLFLRLADYGIGLLPDGALAELDAWLQHRFADERVPWVFSALVVSATKR